MDAMIIRSYGGPEVLERADLPRPLPLADEVLIRVRAAGVNPVDYKVRSGGHKCNDARLPAVLGHEVAGEIESVGERISNLKRGDEVYAFLAANCGGYAQYAIAKADEVAPKPVTLDYVHAAGVPLAATTAWQALFDHGNLRAGQRVLIHGAAGGVGHFAVQFAKAKDAIVFAHVAPEDVYLVRNLGADEVIDCQNTDFEQRASGMDLVIDLVGGETQQRSWRVLKRGGTLVSTVQQPSQKKAVAYGAQGKAFTTRPRQDQLIEIARLIDDGKVRVLVRHARPLEEARHSHEELEIGHSSGKLVLMVA